MTLAKFDRVLKKLHPIFYDHVINALAANEGLTMGLLYRHILDSQDYDYDRRPVKVGVIYYFEYIRYHKDLITFKLL